MLTCFASREEKKFYFGNKTGMITAAFAQIAVALLYRLDALTSQTSTPLRVTPEILAGIYSGSIAYWNDTKIQRANLENSALLPYKKIKVSAEHYTIQMENSLKSIQASSFETTNKLPSTSPAQ